jgi:uncharacterized protein YycO
VPTDREEILAFAQAQLGKPYGWGAEGPSAFDCSGLVYAAYKAAGLPVKRVTAASLGKSGQPVSLAAAVAGDVIYRDNPGATDHVGIYIGNGQMIHAPTEGQPVQVGAVGNVTSIRRMLGADGKPLPPEGAPGDIIDWGNLPNPAEVIGGALSELNPFAGWQSDVLGIALKVAAAGAAAALVIVGAKTALANKEDS